MTALQLRAGRRRWNAHETVALACRIVNGAAARRARCSRCFPLLWMLSVSFMAPGEASTLSAAAAARRIRRSANYRELFARAGMGRYLVNSLLLAAR